MTTPDNTGNEKPSENPNEVNTVTTTNVIPQLPLQQTTVSNIDKTGSIFSNNPAWLIVTLVIVTILGNGVLWQWQSLMLAKKDSELKHQEAALNRVVKTAELRKDENNLYRQIIEMSQTFTETRDAHVKTPSAATHNKMETLRRQLEILKSDFLLLEKQLAEIETRSPRPITLEFIPPTAPQNLRIIQ